MLYSPEPVESGVHTGGDRVKVERLEERLAELEGLAESLDGVPDEEVVNVLAEVNAGLEEGLRASEGEARELSHLLERMDFGPFDEALERAERPPGGAGAGGH
jgi:hypothetical protein